MTFFNQLLSTKNVNVARYARNVEWDFFCDFQTLCISTRSFYGFVCIFVVVLESIKTTTSREVAEEPIKAENSHFPWS